MIESHFIFTSFFWDVMLDCPLNIVIHVFRHLVLSARRADERSESFQVLGMGNSLAGL